MKHIYTVIKIRLLSKCDVFGHAWKLTDAGTWYCSRCGASG
jgi:hypothetical protein